MAEFFLRKDEITLKRDCNRNGKKSGTVAKMGVVTVERKFEDIRWSDTARNDKVYQGATAHIEEDTARN